MRYIAIALMSGLAACSFSSSGDDNDGPGIAAQGTGSTRNFQVADFTGVELSGSDDVDVRVGTGFSVRAEGPAKELDELRIVKEGDSLKVGRRNRNGMSWGKHDKVRVFVTVPRLADATVAGSGTLSVDRIEGARFEGGMAGSGRLAIAALAVEEVKFDIAGSGDVSAAGTARALDVEVAGSGSLTAAGLKASRADVAIAGSGDVRAAVAGPAKISMMGSGDVDLGPQAQCTTTKMGSGSVRCGS